MKIITINGEEHKLIDLYVKTDAKKILPRPGDYVNYVIYHHLYDVLHCSHIHFYKRQ